MMLVKGVCCKRTLMIKCKGFCQVSTKECILVPGSSVLSYEYNIVLLYIQANDREEAVNY